MEKNQPVAALKHCSPSRRQQPAAGRGAVAGGTPEFDAYCARIDRADLRVQDRRQQRLERIILWIATVGAVWLAAFAITYFAGQTLRGLLS